MGVEESACCSRLVDASVVQQHVTTSFLWTAAAAERVARPRHLPGHRATTSAHRTAPSDLVQLSRSAHR